MNGTTAVNVDYFFENKSKELRHGIIKYMTGYPTLHLSGTTDVHVDYNVVTVTT